MSAKIKKLTECLKALEANSEVDGCAIVSERGQMMGSVLTKDVDDKAVAAMAAALMSIGTRVGSTLGSGTPKSMVIEGTEKSVIVKKANKAAVIATAPANAKIGLIDFEMEKTTSEIDSIL
ncbi:MAG: roadblock/LC7 domain-containing protein [Candidatus Thorarchaeota archaeon]